MIILHWKKNKDKIRKKIGKTIKTFLDIRLVIFISTNELIVLNRGRLFEKDIPFNVY